MKACQPLECALHEHAMMRADLVQADLAEEIEPERLSIYRYREMTQKMAEGSLCASRDPTSTSRSRARIPAPIIRACSPHSRTHSSTYSTTTRPSSSSAVTMLTGVADVRELALPAHVEHALVGVDRIEQDVHEHLGDLLDGIDALGSPDRREVTVRQRNRREPLHVPGPRGHVRRAEPPLLPPGTRVASQGFFAGPYAELSFDEPIANSSMLVLPRITAPASRNRSTMWASYGAM